MRPLARYLGVDDLIANQLEFDDGYATGKLEKPFVAGATKADIMRDYAEQHGIDLARVVGLLRQLLRLPDARRRRPPDRVQPRLAAALGRALATTGRCSISTKTPDRSPATPAAARSARPCGPSGQGPERQMRAIRPRSRSHAASTSSPSTPTPRRASCSPARTSCCEDLPVGTRVIYPKPADRRAAPTRAPRSATRSTTPRTSEPLHALLTPGMKVTIAVDDISLPLPPMRTPDVRADHPRDRAARCSPTTASTTSTSSSRTSLHRRMHDWRDQAHGRRQDLRRLLARPPLQPRRRRSRRHGRARQDRRTARWSRSTGAPPRATSSST